MYLWRGLLMISLIASTSLFGFTTSKISPSGIGASSPPPPATPPPINTKLAPNPKKVTRPKPGDIQKNYLAKPPAKVGVVRQDGTPATETLAGVSPDLFVDVQLFAPSDERFVLNQTSLQRILLHELHLCRIKGGQEAAIKGSEPKAQLRLEVYVIPINDYYAVFMDMRLIEAACPNRIALRPGSIFQGITWERKESFCTQKYDITAVVLQKTDDLAKEFTTKYLNDQPASPIVPEAVIRKASEALKAPPIRNR